MIDILRKIARLANEVGPQEGRMMPSYDALDMFLQMVSDLIPIEIWEDVEVKPVDCSICNGKGFVQEQSVLELDYGRTWIEDCSCIVEYEAQLEAQYQEYLAEKSKRNASGSNVSEANVEKVD
jgi:hypothetical protein